MKRTPLRIQIVALAVLLAGGCLAKDPAHMENADKKARIEQMYASYKTGFADVPDATPEELQGEGPLSEAVLLDIRTPEEQAISMLPGAIAQVEFESHSEKYKSQTIVTYCTIGARSGAYAAELMAAGYKVYNLRGSILAWTQAGLPLVGPDGDPTRRVHVYGKRWNLVPGSYDAVY